MFGATCTLFKIVSSRDFEDQRKIAMFDAISIGTELSTPNCPRRIVRLLIARLSMLLINDHVQEN